MDCSAIVFEMVGDSYLNIIPPASLLRFHQRNLPIVDRVERTYLNPWTGVGSIEHFPVQIFEAVGIDGLVGDIQPVSTSDSLRRPCFVVGGDIESIAAGSSEPACSVLGR